jgi:formate hydrogenlyase subunit 4
MEIVLFTLFCALINIPLGIWRRRHKKFSLPWILIVHASIPVVITIRILSSINNTFIPVFILFAVLGQYAGGKRL